MEITKVNNTLTSNTEEIYRLRNHNKVLVTKIKKLKSTKKEDIEGKFLEKQEENNYYLQQQIEELQQKEED